MDSAEISQWFDGYLDAFRACARGDVADRGALLAFYTVPLWVTNAEGSMLLRTEADVAAAVGQQVDGAQRAGYDHTAVLDAELTVVNRSSALYRTELSRRRADAAEVQRLMVTYLVVRVADALRIAMLALG